MLTGLSRTHRGRSLLDLHQQWISGMNVQLATASVFPYGGIVHLSHVSKRLVAVAFLRPERPTSVRSSAEKSLQDANDVPTKGLV